MIVGAGHCGGRAAIALRQQGYVGELLLIGDEPTPPYERPPLSKAVLLGQREVADCQLQPQAAYAEQNIQLRTGLSVTALDAKNRRVSLSDGTQQAFSQLLLANGGRCRELSLPGSQLQGIYTLRHAEDARAIRAALSPEAKVVVIGGGFIGLEVAASARSLGCEVSVLEAAPQLLGRALPAEIAEAVAARHREAGVAIHTQATMLDFDGEQSVSGVRLQDGHRIDADVVIVGIGIQPNSELAEAAGVVCDNGIVTDAYGQTNLSGVFAAGDVANAYRPRYGAHYRLESWQNAEQQAACVASNLLGHTQAYDPVPWVWSDQFDWQLQMAGFLPSSARLVSRPLDERDTLWFALDDTGRLVGVCGLGAMSKVAKEVRVAQMLIEKNAQLSAEALADPNTKLKQLLKQC